jgi:hypothetical protein
MTGAGGQGGGPLRRASASRPMLPTVPMLAMLLLVVSGLAGGTSRAAAAEPQGKRAEAKVEFEKAQLHYRLGRFEDALQAYSRAYELFNAPALLFNIGQCHKNLQNHERAIFFFEGYLREETDPEKRALAEELIAVSRGQLARQRIEPPKSDPVGAAPRADAGAPAAPPPPTTAVTVAPDPASTAPVFVTSPALDEGPTPIEERPLYRTWWFWTAIGVGAAVVTGAAIYYGTAPTTTVQPSGTVGTLDRRR